MAPKVAKDEQRSRAHQELLATTRLTTRLTAPMAAVPEVAARRRSEGKQERRAGMVVTVGL